MLCLSPGALDVSDPVPALVLSRPPGPLTHLGTLMTGHDRWGSARLRVEVRSVWVRESWCERREERETETVKEGLGGVTPRPPLHGERGKGKREWCDVSRFEAQG